MLELPVVEPRHAMGDLEKPKTADVNDFLAAMLIF